MNIPTSTFINLPNNFLTQIFNIAGYLFENFAPLLVIIFGFVVFISILALIVNVFKRD
jgi:hypothetical protein